MHKRQKTKMDSPDILECTKIRGHSEFETKAEAAAALASCSNRELNNRKEKIREKLRQFV